MPANREMIESLEVLTKSDPDVKMKCMGRIETPLRSGRYYEVVDGSFYSYWTVAINPETGALVVERYTP